MKEGRKWTAKSETREFGKEATDGRPNGQNFSTRYFQRRQNASFKFSDCTKE
jgi:hypothetical protein